MNYFNERAKTYDDYISVEKYLADRLFALTEERFYEKILEIGTGTGLFTRKIVTRARNIYTVDSSPKMIKIAKDKLKNFTGIFLYNIDADKIYELKEYNFDLIASSASLHFLKNPYMFIQRSYYLLNKYGNLAFTTFGPKTYQELYSVLKQLHINLKGNIFQKSEYWQEITKKAGFKTTECETKTITSFVPSTYHLLKIISKTGANLENQEGNNLSISEIKLIMEIYDNQYKSELGIPVSYEIIEFKAKKY